MVVNQTVNMSVGSPSLMSLFYHSFLPSVITSFPVLTTLCLSYCNSHLTVFPGFTFSPFSAFYTLMREKKKKKFHYVIPCSKFSSDSRSTILYNPIANLVSSFSPGTWTKQTAFYKSFPKFQTRAQPQTFDFCPFSPTQIQLTHEDLNQILPSPLDLFGLNKALISNPSPIF